MDMINFFNYYHESTDPIRVKINGTWRDLVDFSTPRFQKISGFDDFPIMCPSLVEPFITTQQYLDFATIQSDQTVIDLGCYSGLTSIAFSKAVGPNGRIISIEPDPVNFICCEKNIFQHMRSKDGVQNPGQARMA